MLAVELFGCPTNTNAQKIMTLWMNNHKSACFDTSDA